MFWAGHSRIHLANLFMRVGTQLKEKTVHKTYGTLKEIREGWVSPGFSICRALRSDCLFPLAFFRGGGSREGSGRGLVGRGIIWHCTGNPDKSKHICFNIFTIKCTFDLKPNRVQRRMPNYHRDSSQLLRSWGDDRRQQCMADFDLSVL